MSHAPSYLSSTHLLLSVRLCLWICFSAQPTKNQSNVLWNKYLKNFLFLKNLKAYIMSSFLLWPASFRICVVLAKTLLEVIVAAKPSSKLLLNLLRFAWLFPELVLPGRIRWIDENRNKLAGFIGQCVCSAMSLIIGDQYLLCLILIHIQPKTNTSFSNNDISEVHLSCGNWCFICVV